jgi:hypothetical protein
MVKVAYLSGLAAEELRIECQWLLSPVLSMRSPVRDRNTRRKKAFSPCTNNGLAESEGEVRRDLKLVNSWSVRILKAADALKSPLILWNPQRRPNRAM